MKPVPPAPSGPYNRSMMNTKWNHPFTLPSGGNAAVSDRSICVRFDHPRKALSTAIWGGGLHMVTSVINWKLTEYYRSEEEFPGGSVASYLALAAEKLSCDPAAAAVLLTSARMDWHAFRSYQCHGLKVDIIATAGVEKTAARAGEPAFYEERDHHFYPAGTINLMVFTSGALPDGIMARSLITITEGKTAALQDMGIASVATGASATGTATDGITFVTDPKGPLYTDAGSFSKLGELLGRAAYEAVTSCITDFDRPWNRFDALVTPPPVSIARGKDKP